jgi:hypothetical protein
MTRKTTISMRKLALQVSIVCLLVILVVGGFASSYSKGGGGDKKNKSSLMSNFTPIRSVNGFTLRSIRPTFSGSFMMTQEKENNRLSISTLITYQRGNTTYIIPYKYRVGISSLTNSSKTNLQLLGVKIRMPK